MGFKEYSKGLKHAGCSVCSAQIQTTVGTCSSTQRHRKVALCGNTHRGDTSATEGKSRPECSPSPAASFYNTSCAFWQARLHPAGIARPPEKWLSSPLWPDWSERKLLEAQRTEPLKPLVQLFMGCGPQTLTPGQAQLHKPLQLHKQLLIHTQTEQVCLDDDKVELVSNSPQHSSRSQR